MSSDFPILLDLFDKSPASLNKFWKLYLHLLITPENDKKTRKYLKNYLKVSEANITQILTVLESKGIVYFSRDLKLLGKGKEFVELDFMNVIHHLAIEAGLEGDDLEDFENYLYDVLEGMDLPRILDKQWYQLFDRSETKNKFLSLLIKTYPPLFFVLPVFLFLSASQLSFTEDNIRKIPRVVMKWAEGFYTRLMTVLVEKIIPDINIPRFGLLKQLELDLNEQEQVSDHENTSEESGYEENISIFEIIEAAIIGLSDGYFIRDGKIHLSIPLTTDIQEKICPEVKVLVSVTTKDGQKFEMPVTKSWMMDYGIFRNNKRKE